MKVLIFSFIIFFIGIFVMAFYHEQAHVQIFKYHGIDSRVEYFSEFPTVVTIPEENCKTESCTLAHSINDSIGYHLIVMYVFLGWLLLGIIYSNEKNKIAGEDLK